MNQNKRQRSNKRAARLRAMVPIDVLVKNIDYSDVSCLQTNSKELNHHEFDDFLCNVERLSPPIPTDEIIDNVPFVSEIQETSPKSTTTTTTIKRGRLRRKEIALNPELYQQKNVKKRVNTPKYSCEICEKTFVSLFRLQLHQQIHLPKEEKDALKKYHCEYCPRTFKELNKLNSHRSFKHLKEYKFICEICGKPFINSSELKRHTILSHNARQPCTICGKQVLNLEAHFKDVHENSPKTCTICLEILPNQKKLNKHRYLKHPFQIYECEICERTFSEKFCYKKHMNEKHGVVVQDDLIY